MDRQEGHLPFEFREVSSNMKWIKIVGIGSINTGKTSLIKYFCENKVLPLYLDIKYRVIQVHAPYSVIDNRVYCLPLTSPVHYYIPRYCSGGLWLQSRKDQRSRSFIYDHYYAVRVHLWDMSGNDDYTEVRNELYSGSDAIFICYDVTDPTSFLAVDKWLKELQQYSTGTVLLVLVGNKADLRSKGAVPSHEAKRFANQHGMSYFETSCLNGDGVHDMFTNILKSIQMQSVISII